MGHNGRPKLSVPYLCFLDGEEGRDQSIPLPPLSSSPLPGAFCCRNQSGPVLLPLYPEDREMSLLLCYCTSREGHCSADSQPTSLLIPILPEDSSLPGRMEFHSGVSWEMKCCKPLKGMGWALQTLYVITVIIRLLH